MLINVKLLFLCENARNDVKKSYKIRGVGARVKVGGGTSVINFTEGGKLITHIRGIYTILVPPQQKVPPPPLPTPLYEIENFPRVFMVDLASPTPKHVPRCLVKDFSHLVHLNTLRALR